MRLTDKDIQKIKYYIEHDSGLNKQDLTNMVDTIEALQQELDSLQRCYKVTCDSWKKRVAEIVDWKSRYEELDAGHSKLFKDFCEMKKENDRLKERLQISPYGDDKIDELEQAQELTKFELEQLKIKYVKVNKFEQSQCAKLLAQNGAMREALKRAESLLKTIEQATEYIKPGTGVWHTVGIALQEIHEALYNSADEFGPVNLNSVEPDKVIIPHNPADVEALKQAKEALRPLIKLAVLVRNEKHTKGEHKGAGVAKEWTDSAKKALAKIAEVMGE